MPPVEPRRGPARPLVRRRRIRLCSVALALLGALIFATGANASELAVEPPTDTGTSVELGAGATEATTPLAPAPQTPETQVVAPSPEGAIPAEPAVPTVEAELPIAEAPAPAPESPAPEAPAPEAQPEAPAPEAPAPSPPAEPSPGEAPVVSPPEVRPPEVKVEPPASEAIVESTTEPASEKTGAEHPQEPASAASPSEATVVARSSEASSTKGTLSAGGASPPGPPDAGLALGSPIDPVVLTTGSSADGTAAPLTATAARIASAAIAARKSAAFGAGPLDCAKALQANPGEGCSSWVVAPQLSESSALPLGAPDGPLPPDPNGGASSAGGGHSVLSAPVGTSTPGPQPGGASGGASAAGGGGGFATSGLLTLAGLLLLAAPRAMRLLRLLCRPWRGTCFALIPERPG